MLIGKVMIRRAAVFGLALAAGVASDARAAAVYSWGSNSSGKLGQGSTASTPVTSPALVSGLSSVNVTSVAAGGTFGMALSAAGTVYVWGANNSKQLADGSSSSTIDFNAHPNPALITTFPANTVVTRLAGQQNAGMAINSGGAVLSWGANNSGNTGTGTSTSTTPAVPTVSSPTGTFVVTSGVTVLAAGQIAGYAVQNGALYAWGGNSAGQLGNGGTNANGEATPAAVMNMGSGVTAVAGGQAFATDIQNGTVYAWGQGSLGALGNGGTTSSSVPVAVSGVPTGATQVAAGSSHGLALANNTVYSWGNNNNGQLGNGTTTIGLTAAAVAGITGTIIQIAANDFASYALTSDGKIWVWGDNDSGQLGLGNTTSFSTPQLLTAPAGIQFTSISTGLANGTNGFVLATAVPEPAVASLVVGIAVLAGRRRRSSGSVM